MGFPTKKLPLVLNGILVFKILHKWCSIPTWTLFLARWFATGWSWSWCGAASFRPRLQRNFQTRPGLRCRSPLRFANGSKYSRPPCTAVDAGLFSLLIFELHNNVLVISRGGFLSGFPIPRKNPDPGDFCTNVRVPGPGDFRKMSGIPGASLI